MTHVDGPSSTVERKRVRQMDCGLKPSRHKPATAQSCLIQAERRLETVRRLCGGAGLSSRVACEAARSNSDRPSVYICPSAAAEQHSLTVIRQAEQRISTLSSPISPHALVAPRFGTTVRDVVHARLVIL